jgi:hypothetical protein
VNKTSDLLGDKGCSEIVAHAAAVSGQPRPFTILQRRTIESHGFSVNKRCDASTHAFARVAHSVITHAWSYNLRTMARITYTNSEPLTVEIDGQEHFGTLTTKGAQEVRMTVEYKGKEISDGRKWGTDAEEQHNMRVIAKTLLLRMVYDDLRKHQRGGE